MKALERIELVENIGRELQKRMSYSDIDVYLKAHEIDTNKTTSGINSKRIYVKELLNDANLDVILRIADELKIPYSNSESKQPVPIDATFWAPSHFKLFISHLSTFKKNTGLLQMTLKQYGISGFVAHVDIEPTKQWLDEIEAGLNTM